MASRIGSRWRWGGVGCAVVSMALWVAAWVMIGQQLRRSDAFTKLVAARGGPITLARVPGGIARQVNTGPVMMIQDVAWSHDSRYLLFTAVPEFSLGKMMRVSSSGGNPFDIEGNNKRMQREMLRMMAPRLNCYDLKDMVARQLAATHWPPNLHPQGKLSLSPDGRYLALKLVDYSQLSSMEDQFKAAGQLYVVPMGKDLRLGEPQYIGQASQFHWLPDSRRLLYLQDSGPQSGTYLTSVTGGKTRRLGTKHADYRLWAVAADQPVAYCLFGSKDRNPVGKSWALRHLDLRTGEFRDVPLRDGPERLGPLKPSEEPFVTQAEGDGEPSQIAAVDFATGQVRWLRRDLNGRYLRAQRLLGGQALLLTTSSPGNGGDSQAQFAVLSLHDGKVRLFPQPGLPERPPESWWTSPDGTVLALQSSARKMAGLDPFSMLRGTLWVARLTDTRALLSGPAR